MSRRYTDQISVAIQRTANGVYPRRFYWRSGQYFVSAVLARWIETGKWWQTTPLSSRPIERRIWRVEASAGGRGRQVGVFDLCLLASAVPSSDAVPTQDATEISEVNGYLIRAFD
ncbi:MAG: hypothetical protein K0U64_05305 [Actinomycetia bacterium]|nr:hypothetical protein [Actinomycetes bacterium]